MMENREIQERHRYYKNLAIKLMERQLRVKIKDIMDILKWHDKQKLEEKDE